jgi:hypothetical protein
MGGETHLRRTLDRHDQRRRQGLATVSVLVGPATAAARAWHRGGGTTPIHVDPDAATRSVTLTAGCVAGACRRLPVLAAAMVELGRRLNRPVGDVLGDRSGIDMEHLWRAVPPGHDDNDLLRLIRTVSTRPPGRWATDLGDELPGWRALAAIDRLLGDDHRPGVWVAAPLADEGWLAAAAGPLAALATAVPRWAVGVGVSAAALAAFRAIAGSGRADTLVGGGVVEVPEDGRPTAVAAPAAGVDAADTADAEDDTDPARSEAERFLFALLDVMWPGLFALNRPLPFAFGPRPAEADLFADELRLVIEVDGYHHFRDADDFRRDRRKDWDYQANGYRVVRVLAEDVVPRQDEILDRIRLAVEHCRRHPPGVGPTGTP